MAQVAALAPGASPTKPGQSRRSTTVANWHHDDAIGLVTASDGQQELVGHSSVALLVGRCKAGEETSQTQDDLPSMTGLGSLPHQRVSLPNTARHVSRNHAVFFFLPFAPTRTDDGKSGSWVVRIIGQNGLIIDGKRRRGGQVIRIKSGETEVDFFGTTCRFVGRGKQPQRTKVGSSSSSASSIAEVDKENVSKVDEAVPMKKVASQDSRPTLGTATRANVTTTPFARGPLGEVSTNAPVEDGLGAESQVDAKLVLHASRSPSPLPKTHVERRFVARTEKRPLGAPPSPPTSSPAPFETQSSSPVHPSSSTTFRKPSRLVRGGKGSDEDEDDDDDEGGASSPSPSSPTLDRRAARMHRRPSAEEASQALAVVRTEQMGQDDDAVDLDDDEEDDEDVDEDDKGEDEDGSEDEESSEEDNMTPSPSPKKKKAVRPPGTGLKVKLKRVQFAAHPTSRPTSRASTPRSRTPSQQQQQDGTEKTLTALSMTPLAPLQTHIRTLVSTLAQTYDLEGLLAGAIVFHRTATISATEAVRSVLSSTPGLLRGEVGTEGRHLEHLKVLSPGSALQGWQMSSDADWHSVMKGEQIPGAPTGDHPGANPLPSKEERERVLELYQRKAWRERLEEVLQTRDCFGIIQRAGKDASGNPLECWYYYDRDNDEDKERAKNLGAFAKPIRGALKTHKPM